MASIDFREVCARVTIAQVLDLLEFTPSERRGDQIRGACPIHGGGPESRSFSVNLARSAYRCFRCGSAGNQLDLWAAVTHAPFHEATIELCRRLQMTVPTIAKNRSVTIGAATLRTEKRNP